MTSRKRSQLVVPFDGYPSAVAPSTKSYVSIADIGRRGIVAGDHDCYLMVGNVTEYLPDVGSGLGVEISRRLVDDEEATIANNCTCDCHALPLAPGQLGRQVHRSVA